MPDETQWTIETLKEHLEDVYDARLDAMERALTLQAKEYARRLGVLNHAYENAEQIRGTYLNADKYETQRRSDNDARELALERINEKFEEFVDRFDKRQREVDLELAQAKGEAITAQRLAEEQARKANRNIAIVSVTLAVTIFIINVLTGKIG